MANVVPCFRTADARCGDCCASRERSARPPARPHVRSRLLGESAAAQQSTVGRTPGTRSVTAAADARLPTAQRNVRAPSVCVRL